jgi:hypothetical protein
MIKKEISLFLKNVPGELGRLASLLRDENINIDALAIQDASAYVKELFNARGKSLKRIASTASYDSMRRDSNEYALVRLVVNNVDRTIEIMSQNDYIFDINPVIAVYLENKPGALAEVTSKLGAEGININYIYVTTKDLYQECLAVVSTDEIDRAAAVFGCQ